MARNVKIGAEFDGKAAETKMKAFGANFAGAGAFGNASKAFSGINKAADAAVQSLTGFNLTSLAGVGAVGALATSLKNVVVGWNNYNLSTMKAADNVGMAVDEFSRLVQVADDARVSQETLTEALQMATTNGFKPSIEALAGLADELQGMGVLERNERLAELFGRRWKEVYQIFKDGGPALKDAIGAIDEGLVVTDESVKKAEKLYAAWDNLVDSGTAFGNVVAQEMTPALEALAEVLTDAAAGAKLLFEWNRKLEDAVRDNGKALVNSEVPYKNYIEAQTEAARQAGYLVDAQNGQIRVFRLTANGSVEVANTLGILTRSEYEAAKGADDLTSASTYTNAQMQYMQTYGPGAAGAIYGIGDAATDAASKLRNDLLKAFEDVQSANTAWTSGAGGDLAGMLDAAGLKGGDLTQALIEVDKAMGTNYYTAKLQKDALQKTVDEFKRTGDVDAFGESLQRLKNGGFQALQEGAVLARVRVQELYAELMKLDGQTATAYVNVISGSGGGTMTAPKYDPLGAGDTSSVPTNIYIPHRAGGGGVNSGDPYIVGENGPEVFVPGNNGKIVPNNQLNMGGITFNFYGVNRPGAIADAVQLKLASYGRQYQGG